MKYDIFSKWINVEVVFENYFHSSSIQTQWTKMCKKCSIIRFTVKHINKCRKRKNVKIVHLTFKTKFVKFSFSDYRWFCGIPSFFWCAIVLCNKLQNHMPSFPIMLFNYKNYLALCSKYFYIPCSYTKMQCSMYLTILILCRNGSQKHCTSTTSLL